VKWIDVAEDGFSEQGDETSVPKKHAKFLG
jgi:hypothetical protein